MQSILSLPFELIHKIIDHIGIRDALTLRLVNRYFKEATNDHYSVWKKVKLVVKVTEQEPSNFIKAVKFIQELDKFENIELWCPIELYSEAKDLESYKIKTTNEIELVIAFINIHSLGILNVFSDCCVSLVFRRFTAQVYKFKYIEELKAKLRLHHGTCISMKKLRRLKINLHPPHIRLHVSRTFKEFGHLVPDWNFDMSTQLIDALNINKQTCKSIEINEYAGSREVILKFLNGLNLDELCLKNPKISKQDLRTSLRYKHSDSQLEIPDVYGLSAKKVVIDFGGQSYFYDLFNKCLQLEKIEHLWIDLTVDLEQLIILLVEFLLEVQTRFLKLSTLDCQAFWHRGDNWKRLSFYKSKLKKYSMWGWIGFRNFYVDLICGPLKQQQELEEISLVKHYVKEDEFEEFEQLIRIIMNTYPNLKKINLDLRHRCMSGDNCWFYRAYDVARFGSLKLDEKFKVNSKGNVQLVAKINQKYANDE